MILIYSQVRQKISKRYNRRCITKFQTPLKVDLLQALEIQADEDIDLLCKVFLNYAFCPICVGLEDGVLSDAGDPSASQTDMQTTKGRGMVTLMFVIIGGYNYKHLNHPIVLFVTMATLKTGRFADGGHLVKRNLIHLFFMYLHLLLLKTVIHLN